MLNVCIKHANACLLRFVLISFETGSRFKRASNACSLGCARPRPPSSGPDGARGSSRERAAQRAPRSSEPGRSKQRDHSHPLVWSPAASAAAHAASTVPAASDFRRRRSRLPASPKRRSSSAYPPARLPRLPRRAARSRPLAPDASHGGAALSDSRFASLDSMAWRGDGGAMSATLRCPLPADSRRCVPLAPAGRPLAL